MDNLLESLTEEPTIGEGVKLELKNPYWNTLDIYLCRDEFLFSLKGLNGADKITFYKSFKNGLIKTQKFIDKFTK